MPTGRRSSRPPAGPGARGSWPRRSTPSSIGPFRDSSGADHAGLVTAGDMAAWRASYEPAGRRPPLPRRRGREDRCLWGQGPVLLQALAMLEGMPEGGSRPADRRRHPRDHRGAQAGHGRPRGVVRRRFPGHRRGSCSTRRTSPPDGPSSETWVPSSCGRGRPAGASRTCPGTSPRSGGLDRRRRRSGRAYSRTGATPVTSTSSTAGATSSRPRPVAAGCRAHPPSRSWGLASAAGGR